MQMSMIDLWHEMGWFAKGVVFTMAAMSIWSLTVMIQKWWTLRQAMKEDRKSVV